MIERQNEVFEKVIFEQVFAVEPPFSLTKPPLPPLFTASPCPSQLLPHVFIFPNKMEGTISISSPHVPILAARGYRLRALVFGEMGLAYRYIFSGNRKKGGKDTKKASRGRLNFWEG